MDVRIDPPQEIRTTEHLRIAGDIEIRKTVLWIVGAILILLVVSIGMAFAFASAFAPEYARSVLPILSGALFGFIGFIVGQKVGDK